MDVKDFLNSGECVAKMTVQLTGWLVDQEDGLFLLCDHYPEDYFCTSKIKISNGNIIYKILRVVPSLAGGFSLLFYKAKMNGVINEIGEIIVEKISIKLDRNSHEYHFIDIDDGTIEELVSKLGNYNFKRPLGSMRDWLNDFK